MAIEKTKFSEQKDAFERAQSSMESILQIKNLPKEILAEMKKSYDFLASYDINVHNTDKVKKLKGKLLTPKELKKMVVEASGYNKWEVSEEEEPQNHDDHDLKERFGIEFDKFKEYHATRDTNSRSDLWLVRFTCMPGHVYISLDTGRVGWDIEAIIKNEDALKMLEKEISANF